MSRWSGVVTSTRHLITFTLTTSHPGHGKVGASFAALASAVPCRAPHMAWIERAPVQARRRDFELLANHTRAGILQAVHLTSGRPD